MQKTIGFCVVAMLAGCALFDPSKSPEVRRLSAINTLKMLKLSEMAKQTAYFVDKNGLQEAEEKSKQSVLALMKDPDSSKFRNIREVSIPDGIVFCGEVNSKNSYGGYAGFTWFVAGVEHADVFVSSTNPRKASDIAAENIAISSACKVY